MFRVAYGVHGPLRVGTRIRGSGGMYKLHAPVPVYREPAVRFYVRCLRQPRGSVLILLRLSI